MPHPLSLLKAFTKKKAPPGVILSTAIIILMIFCYVQQPGFLKYIDHKIYDTLLYFHAKAHTESSPVPVIIDIDEDSLAQYGQWPWPRFLVADLLESLQQEGVSASGLDILMVEKDRSSPKHIQDELSRFLDINIKIEGLPPELYDFDFLLAERLKEMPTVLGMYCRFSGGADRPDHVPPGVSYIIKEPAHLPPLEKRLLKADGGIYPLSIFWSVAPLGMLNTSQDSDGVIRRVPMVSMTGGNMHVSLSLRVMMIALDTQQLVFTVDKNGLPSIQLDTLSVPLEPDGSFLVPYKNTKRAYKYISAKDVLEKNIKPGELQGKVAFIGTSAPGLYDLRTTPFERLYPGVEIHATVFDAMISGNFIRQPAWAPGLQVLSIILFGILAALAFGLTSSRIYIIAGIALMAFISMASVYSFQEKGLFFSPLYTLLTVLFQGAFLLMLRFWQSEKQKNFLRESFGRYVAPEIVERISNREQDILAGSELEVSIMFTDLCNFTSLAENLQPRQTVQLLNQYFTAMTSLVRTNKGTLDKFIGDALMAFWNAPLPVSNHPVLAVQTALDMQKKLTEINSDLLAEFGCELTMRIGINTGTAYVGNMGSKELLNYTLIGDNVNLASRIERICAQYGIGIAVSEATKNRCGDHFVFQCLDIVRVKGKQKAVPTYTVFAKDEAGKRNGELNDYHEAWMYYALGDFKTASKMFDKLSRALPQNKLYQMFRDRCNKLIASPPATWDGIWDMRSK